MRQPNAPGCSEELAGVELRWSLSEALPVEDPDAVAEVDDVARIERPMQEACGAILRLGPLQRLDQRRTGGSQRRIGVGQCDDPLAGMAQHTLRIQ